MLTPISWLKDYVNITVSPEVLAKKLVAIGFEVEGIEYQEKKVSKVVTGKILSVEKHPNADKLRVTQIDVGNKTIQVVTNVAVVGGENIAVALDGATLDGGHKIVKGELRGVVSEGMLCGLAELGLTVDDVAGQSKDGIILFEDGTKLGINALKALGYDDVVLDIGVTANRPDCNSIYKLAKEVAVALKTDCREPEISYTATGKTIKNMVSVDVLDTQLCPRYMAAGVRGVKIFPSSQLIKSRLSAVGIRPINNIVDITNYVLTEIGQPMHAFDLRHLSGGRIVVRRAQEGEKIVTLNGKENTLKNSMLVICDAEKPVAVAGVMGGENSGIENDTTAIVFESAKFARDSIRRTSRALGLRSDSSARYEKGIDFASQEYGIKRALTLIYQSGSGEIAEDIIDEKVEFEKDRKITFTVAKIEKILGCKVPKGQLIAILGRLGIGVEAQGKELIATIPDVRDDIAGVNDLAEEFIRVYGYQHIESTLFAHSPHVIGGKTEKMKFVDKVKNTAAALGFNECTTYSFTSPHFADMMSLPAGSELRTTINVMNPLGEALSVMRTTLVHSMLETLVFNKTHFNHSAMLFEIAKVYIPKYLPMEELANEEERLVVGMYGEGSGFFELKGALEKIFETVVFKASYKKSVQPFLHTGRAADIFAGDRKIGFVGEIHPDTADKYGADARLYIAEISIDALVEESAGQGRFKNFSKFPTIQRDLAVIVADSIPAGDLIGAVKAAQIKHLDDVTVFDTYKSEQIGAGKKSVALNFSFSSLERTLTDDEISVEMTKILNVLKKSTGAKIRE